MTGVGTLEAAAPVSSGQARMWFLDQLGAPGAYNVALAFELPRVSVEVLERALAAVTARHDALRATFALGVGGLEQRLREHAPVEVDVVDGDPAAAVRDAASRPFDLATGPLVRARVVRRPDQADLVTVAIHHIAADSSSLDVLASDLWECYFAFADGRTPELAPVTTSYADYARWQRTWLDSDECRNQLAYWRSRLAGAPQEVPLPTGGRRRLDVPPHGGSVTTTIEGATYAALVELTLDRGATLFMTTVTLYACMLAAVAGVDDAVVAIGLLNRPRPELERVVGYFTNTLPFRIDCVRGRPFSAALDRVRDLALDAYANQEVPFERIVGEIAPTREPDRIPLTNVAFGVEERAEGYAGRVRRVDVPEVVHVRFDLAALVVPRARSVTVTLYHNASLLASGDVRRWVELYASMAERAARDPEAVLT